MYMAETIQLGGERGRSEWREWGERCNIR